MVDVGLCCYPASIPQQSRSLQVEYREEVQWRSAYPLPHISTHYEDTHQCQQDHQRLPCFSCCVERRFVSSYVIAILLLSVYKWIHYYVLIFLAVYHHNEMNPDDLIKTVLCPGLGTAVGRMPYLKCAVQMRTAFDAVVHKDIEDINRPTSLSQCCSSHVALVRVCLIVYNIYHDPPYALLNSLLALLLPCIIMHGLHISFCVCTTICRLVIILQHDSHPKLNLMNYLYHHNKY